MIKRSVITILLLLLAAPAAEALPRYAVKYKDRCADCHVNPTGGGMRNENGFYFGKNVLSMISPRDKEFKVSPKIGENISFGLDYRGQFLYSEEKKRTDFQDMTGAVYANVAFSEDIDAYARYDFAQFIWEAFAVARILPNDSYIKVGTFVPNYGVRLDDHTAYTRGGDLGLLFSTGTRQGLYLQPSYVETGIEAGIHFSDLGLLTVSAGQGYYQQNFTKDPSYTARLELTPSAGPVGLLIGGSYAAVKTPLNSGFYGGFAGIATDKISLIVEYDIAENLVSNDITSAALMAEASYTLMVGLEAVLRYDRFDPDVDSDSDEVSRIIVGLDFMPYAFVEVMPQYRLQMEDPETSNNSFVLQFHFWY